VTGVSTEASVDSAPGSAIITLSIPDNDVNDFYVEGKFVVIEMMEVEIFGKGYYTIGGFPQYYRMFWGLISSINRSWSNGVTTITLSCRDILRWWELTNVNKNPAFLDASKSQAGYQLFQNKFAGLNPYTVIIALAKDAMGDFSLTTGSFTSFRPEQGPEQGVIGQYAKDIMTYWQLKFGNIWNNLVLYGTSGQAYTFTGDSGDVSPLKISEQIFAQEAANLNLNPETSLFKIQPHEVAAFKIDVPRAGDVDFFQSEIQTKLSIAFTARDQISYEFYCDTTGDIVFKPPFYNLNVIPNKPVSWIYDFEILDDSLTDSEQEVVTHVTSSGNAFGGPTDWGLNDEITTPRTGVVDWHLLKRYGWRHLPMQVEWAGNARKLFYHLLDFIDRVNAKRQSGTVTIPMRPELRMGFPVWIPRFDSFYYVAGISHNFAPGGQATSILTLTAKRSKFIAPKNIGRIEFSQSKTTTYKDSKGKNFTQNENAYEISFPSDVGQTSGLTDLSQQADSGGPAILRDPKTGKQLGFPNAVMVYRTALNQEVLARVMQQQGSTKSHKPTKQDKQSAVGPYQAYNQVVRDILTSLQNDKRAETIDRLRLHRYEAGMTNAGAYDYAWDVDGVFKEFSVIPADKITWKAESGAETGAETKETRQKDAAAQVNSLTAQRPDAVKASLAATKALSTAKKDFGSYLRAKYNGNPPKSNQYDADDLSKQELVTQAQTEVAKTSQALNDLDSNIKSARAQSSSFKTLTAINVMVRPVSDEFGFEVVGHYRYGRGVFIDRGQVQLPDPNSTSDNPNVVNKLGIQFAAQGGLLTDNPTLVNLGTGSTNFADEFEKLQPDDYLTGATFKGANYNSDSQLQDVNPTSQQTYDSSIDNAVTRNGRAIFAEADATRRAQTLADLKPSSTNGLDDVGFEKCACQLGRSEWLSVLPQEFIAEILKPASATTITNDGLDQSTGVDSVSASQGQSVPNIPITPPEARFGSPDSVVEVALRGFQDPSVTADLQTDPTPATSITLGQGNIVLDGPGGFFEVLRKYLTQRFDRDYQENMWREKYAISGGQDVVRSDERPDDNNILSPPDDALFNRASQGDPNALKALSQGANFDFGRTNQALKDFQRESAEANAKMKSQLAASSSSGNQQPIFSITTSSSGPARQSFQPPAPVLKLPAVANPSGYPNFGSGNRGDAGTSVGPGDSQTRI
jgi:hypothetical protein